MSQRFLHSSKVLRLERYAFTSPAEHDSLMPITVIRRRSRSTAPSELRTTYLASSPIIDINALTPDDRNLLESARPAFKKYNEVQLTTVKLPGASKHVRHSLSCTGIQGKKPDIEIVGSCQLLQFARRRQILRRGKLKLVRVRSYNTSTATSKEQRNL